VHGWAPDELWLSNAESVSEFSCSWALSVKQNFELKSQERPISCRPFHCGSMQKSPAENSRAPSPETTARLRQIGFLPLLALFYGYAADGPFGYEEIFRSSGPGARLSFVLVVY